MKFNNIFPLFFILLLSSCTGYFLDLDDPANVTEDSYFTKPHQFREAANELYNALPSFRDKSRKYRDFFNYGNDLMTTPNSGDANYAYGIITIPISDDIWNGRYASLRSVNKLLELAEKYPGDPEDITQNVGEAYFFRAYNHFALMQHLGGVPIVTRVLETDSEELTAPRNSRYEVTAQILADLEMAIERLPLEGNIPNSYKGLISKQAAKAYKARVLLHEATWMKYVGTKTDGDGSATGAGTAGRDEANINIYLTEAVQLAKEVIDDPTYELFNYNDQVSNMSHFFLFNLDPISNPNPIGLDKTSNKEFIISRKHDMNLFHDGNPSQYGRLAPSRKMMDMILCSDGLPIEKSSLFQGYTNAGDEYINRDYRMKGYFSSYFLYGNYTDLTSGVMNNSNVRLLGFNDADAGGGYQCHKFTKFGQGETQDVVVNGGTDMPFLRLAEMYLTYIEAVYELRGSVTDEDLNISINKTRERAGLPALTNSFIAANGLNIGEEIRREWAIEFYAEGHRFNNLKRWGIAEQALGEPILGMVVEGTAFENDPERYQKDAYPNDPVDYTLPNGQTLKTIVCAKESDRYFKLAHYLNPIPSGQILLNTNLKQNPGY
ncbi:RagB/SusD family nutrient uptake outer membrane protein [Persicobacter psychrovividus]|uniref:Membrane protein n=1 Tax=Persicobacter psychrovividus TaxID=387638 RepID=A0ABM7VLV1_9BACT|nr:membrane protein [Persicobacter psychrovividus]